jgi:D-beta-D-heptose 7-phosphate kinase/D-beta-D-heptose 1-phosphate adenosyltransferase
MKAFVVGDALLDVDLDGSAQRLAPDAPVPVISGVVTRRRAGGAGLGAMLLARDGIDVTLVTAIGTNAAGRRLAEVLDAAGIEVRNVAAAGATPQKTRVRARGQSVARIDEECSAWTLDRYAMTQACEELRDARAVLVADYGGPLARHSAIRCAIEDGAARALVWDPHVNGPAPVAAARLVTPNDLEAANSAGVSAPLAFPGRASEIAIALRRRWRVGAVAVTCGHRGAVLATGDALPLAIPAEAVANGDVCGAGDRLATTAVAALMRGALPSEAVRAGVAAASAFVAGGGAAAITVPRPAVASAAVTVATSGCFDLLHAGHVHALRAARALGDRLVVLVNSDRSVRRLKGPGRPVVPAAGRVAVLRSLSFVDEVVLFDDDTPEHALQQLRPDVFAKGGDYDAATLPESKVLAQWGGRTVIVPYLDGRSTTRIVEEVRSVR